MNINSKSQILYRLNTSSKDLKDTLIKRIEYTGSKLVDFSGISNQKSNIWEEIEFVTVLDERYSCALIWDYSSSDRNSGTFAKYCIIYNSKRINDILSLIANNSNAQIQKCVSERRENSSLNQSINELIKCFDDKTEELLFSSNEKSSLIQQDEIQKTAQTVNEKAKFISHEIKNSLSVINLYSRILDKRIETVNTDKETTLSIQNAIKCIENASENISSLIGSLRCLSSLYITEVNIKPLIENVILMCTQKAQGAGILIKSDNLEDLIINTDKSRLECALINIIYNGIEACSDGCKINISVNKTEKQLKIRIKNDGAKIPEENIEKIFEENYTTKDQGNGLGLYFCNKQLKEAGGKINLVISDEKETVFEIVLPL